jgi:SAM-dependent methyltransferase
MPLEPLRRNLIREKLIDYFKPKEGTNIHRRAVSQSLARRLYETGHWFRPGAGELDDRWLYQVSDIFIHASRKHKPNNHLTYLPYVNLKDIIKSFFVQGVKRVNVLDVGAGKGRAGNELKMEFGNNIKYTGVDLQQRDNKSVKQLDVVSEKLPFETYHLIFGAHVFQYLPDKFKALENMINALKPGGVLKLASSDYNILYDVVLNNVDPKIDPAFFIKSVIEESNSFL